MMHSNWRFSVAFYLVVSIFVIGINVSGIICEDEEVNEAKNEAVDRAVIDYRFHEEKDVTKEHWKVISKESFTFVAGEKVKFTNISRINCAPEDLCKKAQIKIVNCTGYITPVEIKKSTVDYNCTSDRNLTELNLKETYAIKSCIWKRNNETSYVYEVCVLNINLRETLGSGCQLGLIIGIIGLAIAVLVLVITAYKLAF